MSDLLFEHMREQARAAGAEIGTLRGRVFLLELRIKDLTRTLSQIAGAPIDQGANPDAEELQAIARVALDATPIEFGGFRQIGDVIAEAAE